MFLLDCSGSPPISSAILAGKPKCLALVLEPFIASPPILLVTGVIVFRVVLGKALVAPFPTLPTGKAIRAASPTTLPAAAAGLLTIFLTAPFALSAMNLPVVSSAFLGSFFIV